MHMKIELNKFHASGYSCFSGDLERWFAALHSCQTVVPWWPACSAGGGPQHLAVLVRFLQHWSLNLLLEHQGLLTAGGRNIKLPDPLSFAFKWHICFCISDAAPPYFTIGDSISASLRANVRGNAGSSSVNQGAWLACTLGLNCLLTTMPNCKSLGWDFPRRSTKAMCLFILILEWVGVSAKIVQMFLKAILGGNTLYGLREIFWERRIAVQQRIQQRTAALCQACSHEDLHI